MRLLKAGRGVQTGGLLRRERGVGGERPERGRAWIEEEGDGKKQRRGFYK